MSDALDDRAEALAEAAERRRAVAAFHKSIAATRQAKVTQSPPSTPATPAVAAGRSSAVRREAWRAALKRPDVPEQEEPEGGIATVTSKPTHQAAWKRALKRDPNAG